MLDVLMLCVVFDYFTGIFAAWAEKTLSSRIGFVGIAKKAIIFILVAVCHKVDLVLGNAHFFRDAVVFFYIANEMLSILENAGRIGVPIPPVIQQAVAALKGKGGVDKL